MQFIGIQQSQDLREERENEEEENVQEAPYICLKGRVCVGQREKDIAHASTWGRRAHHPINPKENIYIYMGNI